MVLWIILQLLFVAVAVASNGSSVQMCRDDERQALLAFKMGFSISNDSDPNLIWSCADPAYAKTESWSSSSDCCDWDGVTCDSLSGHVVELHLSCSLLTGSLPSNSTLFLLRRLRHLSLASNSFSSSPIPPGLGQLSHLTYLDLSYSGFSGQVPREIGWLSHLATLDLSYNDQLKMPNFQTIMGANLTHLRKLDLSFVSISSNLPPIIANLSKLAYLGLSFCGLQGEFPAVAVLSLPELRVIDLYGNSGLHADFSAVQYWRSPLEVVHFTMCNFFTGKLPESIGDPSNSSLQSFRIAGCQFYGDIPSWMWTVAVDIDLSDTLLSGSLPTNVNTTMLAGLLSIEMLNSIVTGIIPGWIFTLPSLNNLDLEHNLFTGIGEFDIGNGSIISTSLTTLVATDNRLQGQIPEGIFDFHNLEELDLDGNNLTGTIPLSKLLKLQSLETLFLSDNNLSIIDDMGADVVSTPSWPSFEYLGLSSCNLGHFPGFLRNQVNLTWLELSNNGIHGVVPHWLWNISNLDYLNLSHNSLSGGLEQLPLQSTGFIDIQYNLFQGVVPVPSPSTWYFSASNNRFTGAIPPSLCDIGALTLLDMAQNNLTGNIPDCFASLISQQLLILDLSQNQLQDAIPSSLFQDCPKLITLSLNGNKLEGPIPHSLSNCLQLHLLDLSSNKLNHTFPHWLGVLPSLEALILGSNNLQGSLMGSNTTNSFPRLRILDISDNDLTGILSGGLLMSMKAMVKVNNTDYMPYMGLSGFYRDSIMAWVKGITRRLDAILEALVSIDVSRNRFQGPIPEAIGDLVSLRSLNLAHNNFTGHIPSSLSNLTLLESLDLSYNRLDGGIPSELVNLNSLEVFNVSENDLVGPVPTGKQFDTFSDPSYLGNPGLCGPLLTNKCGKPNDPPNPAAAAEGSSDESSGSHVWEIGLMGYGCGLVIGLAWGYLFFWKMTPKWVLILEIQALAIVHQWRRRRCQNRRR